MEAKTYVDLDLDLISLDAVLDIAIRGCRRRKVRAERILDFVVANARCGTHECRSRQSWNGEQQQQFSCTRSLRGEDVERSRQQRAQISRTVSGCISGTAFQSTAAKLRLQRDLSCQSQHTGAKNGSNDSR